MRSKISILGFILMILAVPSIVLAQDLDEFPQGVTVQELSAANIIEDKLKTIRESIIADGQILADQEKAGDKPGIKEAKEQLARDWHDYRVQRLKLKKLAGIDYQNSDLSRHWSLGDVPPVVVTLQELVDIRTMEDRLKLLKGSIATDRQALDLIIGTSDAPKIKIAQEKLNQDFHEYKEQRTALKILKAQVNTGMDSLKKRSKHV